MKKSNEQNIILSRDHRFVSIAAAVALKRQSTGDSFKASERQSTWASSKEKSEKGK